MVGLKHRKWKLTHWKPTFDCTTQFLTIFWWPDILPYSRVDVGYVLVFTIQGHVASSFHTDGADRKRHCKALLILAGADLVIGY